MNRYYIRETTPLKYHTFLRYVGLPLGMLSTLGNFMTLLSGMEAFNGFYLIDFTAYIVSFALMLSSFVGFFSWAKYAWTCLMINYIAGIVYRFIVVIIYSIYAPDQLGNSIGSLLIFAIVSCLIMLYYWKRKPLFSSTSRASEENESYFPREVTDQFAETVSRPAGKYCVQCGAELLPDSAFCSKCGTAVNK